MICAGSAAILVAAYDLYRHPVDWRWFILAGLTLLSGSITVKVPSIPATISVSETFVFTAVMLFGPSAGTLTVALDGFVISLWLQRKRLEAYKAVFNVCALAFSLWCSAHLYFVMAGTPPLSQAPDISIRQLFGPLALFALFYFLSNSFLVAAAIASENKASIFRVWRDNFSFFAVNFFFGASVAALLLAYTREIDLVAVGVIIPLLIISYLTYKSSMGRLEDTTKHLGKLNLLYLSTIETLAMWIDAKDQITHGHIRRVQTLAVDLARSIGVRDEKLIRAIEAAALLHDMGKLAVPEHILNKPGRLTSVEFEKMKLHASIGAQILSSIDFPYPVVPIVRHHHENWDGSGYPDGLTGTEIPIGARILSVVDCFDALTSDRPYRPRLSEEKAVQVITASRGTMYDPLVVDAFLRLHAKTGTNLTVGGRDKKSDRPSGASRVIWPSSAGTRSLTNAEKGQLLEAAQTLVPLAFAALYVPEGEGDELIVSHRTDDAPSELSRWRTRLGQGVSGWVGATRQPIINADPALDFQGVNDPWPAGLRSCLSVPVVASGDLLGVLSLYSTEGRTFSQEHLDLLESRIRRSLSRNPEEGEGLVPRRDEIQGHSPRDRHHSGLVLGELQSTNLGVILARVDGLSDRVTSVVLASLLEAVRRSVRATDITVRTGDSEAVVLLPKLEPLSLEAAVDRIRNAVEALAAGDHSLALTLSRVRIGAALSPEDGATLDTLVACARRRLEPTSRGVDSLGPTVH